MREIELLVLSDIHLGTYGCHAKELLKYLKSINPSRVVLNGDIVDIWQFNKRYWPQSHMQVIKHMLNWINDGVRVDYITGNHDEMLRKFVGFSMENFQIKNKVLLNLDGKRTWIFHGDVFDVTMRYSKWLCKLGAIGYDSLIAINSVANQVSHRLGRGRISLSKKVKNGVKKAIKYINDFEQTAAEIGMDNGYHTVVCGHIHQPKVRTFHKGASQIEYLNSGDWIENCTALEYSKGNWSVYEYFNDTALHHLDYNLIRSEELSATELFDQMLKEFNGRHEQEEVGQELEVIFA
ncbi:MAG: UDP-2,3-diacylglucosamine diphosphatase [Bacteroidetes bacterium]|jgi:UDP-2,3-diacylglucosamine pyrophosphatase LpxH|nr:UDP-2,3-diacylglucosamine diphosphatase [Bacteroidota bacterium]